MKRELTSTSALSDLLVVLGTQRYGTDWTNVAAAIRAAAGPLEPFEAPTVGNCEERYRALVEGVPVELPALAAKLQVRHLETVAEARAALVKRIEELCAQLPARHPSRDAFLAGAANNPGSPALAGGAAGGSADDGDGEGGSRHGGGSGRTRTSGGEAESVPADSDLEESWVAIAEEEERNARRSTVAGTLNKMLSAIAKHKWAYPFKRPVTDKEAPDYKEIITNPMDFTTLKRRVETGQVGDLSALADDLTLIFDNAMKYNGEGTDYYKMASTLKSIVAHQKAMYLRLRPDAAEVKGGGGGGAAASVAAAAASAPPPPTEEADKAPRRGRVPRR